MRAAAYVRVSTEDQTEYSPDAQLKAIKEFCRRNNYLLPDAHVYTEEGKSGRNVTKRPEFQKMIGAAKSKERPFDLIIVHKFDRFARSREDSVVYKALLKREFGIRVVSVTENIEDDKFSVILEAMLEAMAEYYSINLAEEVKKGMTEKAQRGEPLTIAPFGYVMEDKKLIPHPAQSAVVKDIFGSFTAGRPMTAIAQDLNARGIRTNRGNKIELRTVEYILRNPVYTGKIRWTPSGKTRRNYDNPESLVIQGQHEPLVTEEIFDLAHEILMRNKKQWRKYSKAQSSASHWLVGLVRCGACGGGLVKNGPLYMQCNNYVHAKCAVSHALNIAAAEKVILNQLCADSASCGGLIIRCDAKKTDGGDAAYEKQLAGLERRLLRVKEAYGAGIDTLEEYKTNKEMINAEIQRVIAGRDAESAAASGNSPAGQDAINDRLKLAFLTLAAADTPMAVKKAAAANAIAFILFNKPKNRLDIIYNTVI